MAAQARDPGFDSQWLPAFYFLQTCVCLQLNQEVLKQHVNRWVLKFMLYYYIDFRAQEISHVMFIYWLRICKYKCNAGSWSIGFTGIAAGMGISLLTSITLITVVCVVKQKRQTLKRTGELVNWYNSSKLIIVMLLSEVVFMALEYFVVVMVCDKHATLFI